MEPRFLEKLNERKNKGSLRSLSLFEGYTDFFSNDYLGIARNSTTASTHNGSTGSRLISGNSPEAIEAEQFLAGFFESEAALVFNSGYDANLGFFSAVPQKGDTVLYDQLIHASVRDGIRLSHAKSYAFGHNDLEDLEKKLQRAEGTVFVAVESLYSMDGDIAPLEALTTICERYNALLVVDEAHAGGVFGKDGRGLMEALNLQHRCFARLITFGKAYGTHGAVICGSAVLREYLYNFARSFIYTTALPPAHYTMLQQVVETAMNENLRTQLQKNIAYFRKAAKDLPLISDENSPIQILPYDSMEACLAASARLQANKLAVKAILPPTVPENGQRLRICLHAFNTFEEIDHLLRIVISE